jgi:hypothetical protein
MENDKEFMFWRNFKKFILKFGNKNIVYNNQSMKDVLFYQLKRNYILSLIIGIILLTPLLFYIYFNFPHDDLFLDKKGNIIHEAFGNIYAEKLSLINNDEFNKSLLINLESDNIAFENGYLETEIIGYGIRNITFEKIRNDAFLLFNENRNHKCFCFYEIGLPIHGLILPLGEKEVILIFSPYILKNIGFVIQIENKKENIMCSNAMEVRYIDEEGHKKISIFEQIASACVCSCIKYQLYI